jgi:hypothetical protein
LIGQQFRAQQIRHGGRPEPQGGAAEKLPARLKKFVFAVR